MSLLRGGVCNCPVSQPLDSYYPDLKLIDLLTARLLSASKVFLQTSGLQGAAVLMSLQTPGLASLYLSLTLQ